MGYGPHFTETWMWYFGNISEHGVIAGPLAMIDDVMLFDSET